MNPFTALWTGITTIFAEIIYAPIFNLLIIFLALTSGNLGLAIILLTLAVRLILLKPTLAGNNAQKQMTDIQPKIKEIQEKYKDNAQKLSEETMKLMKTEGAGPLKGCLMMLIQLPIFIGLFFVIKDFSTIPGATKELAIHTIANFETKMYSFLQSFGLAFTGHEETLVETTVDGTTQMVSHVMLTNVDHYFLGLDLFSVDMFGNGILAILAATLMYIQIKLTMMNRPKTPAMPAGLPGGGAMPDMSKMMETMNIVMVTMMALFVLTMQSGIGLYIVTTTLFGVVQYIWQHWLVVKTLIGAKFSK